MSGGTDETKYFWYELVVLCQKLVLPNFVLFVNFDRGGENKLLRVAIGLTIALLVLTLQLELQPFRKKSDDAIMAIVQVGACRATCRPPLRLWQSFLSSRRACS